uniref:Uncharacterized protein n=1 Tax=Oryza rufipogon TaxID=4529 RepID=A0A0E0Q1E7_ORYRU
MLSSSSASTTRLSTGRQPLLAPGRRQLLLRLPRRDGDSRSARIRRSRPSPSRGEWLLRLEESGVVGVQAERKEHQQ